MMINNPGYLSGAAGAGPKKGQDPYRQVSRPMPDEEETGLATQRSFELINIAQQLEHIHRRLVSMDLQDSATAIDQVIANLVLRWQDRRTRP
jgi:hypothetical protein